jgi:hypothetical protein
MKRFYLILNLLIFNLAQAQTNSAKDFSSDLEFKSIVDEFNSLKVDDPRNKTDANGNSIYLDKLRLACINVCKKNSLIYDQIDLIELKCFCKEDTKSNSIVSNIEVFHPVCIANATPEIISSDLSETSCLAPELEDYLSHEGSCSEEVDNALYGKLDDEEEESEVDPTVYSLIDSMKKEGSFGDLDYYDLTNNEKGEKGLKEFGKNLNDPNSKFNQFSKILESAMSPEALQRYQSLKTTAADKKHQDHEAAQRNMINFYSDLKQITENGYNLSPEDLAKVTSGYIENFFDETFSNAESRNCRPENFSRTYLKQPEGVQLSGNTMDLKYSNITKSDGTKFPTNVDLSKTSYEDYLEYADAFNNYVDNERAQELKTNNDSQKKVLLLEKNYQDFEVNEEKLCPAPIVSGPDNFSKNFKNNHYKTHDPNYLQNQISQIKDALAKNGEVSNLKINSSCSRVPNTNTSYKRDGLNIDLAKFKTTVFPHLENSEDWEKWLTNFSEEVANKKDPFTISFEHLSRLRSLQLTYDLIIGVGEEDLSKNLKSNNQKISIDWQGDRQPDSKGQLPPLGSSGEPWDQGRGDQSIYEPKKYTNLSFATTVPQPNIDREKKGQPYFAADTIILVCNDHRYSQTIGNTSGNGGSDNHKSQYSGSNKKDKVGKSFDHCPSDNKRKQKKRARKAKSDMKSKGYHSGGSQYKKKPGKR